MAFTQISTKGIKDGTITGADLATNVDLADNQKIRFGAGNDLQIYHDGTNNLLSTVGTVLAVHRGTTNAGNPVFEVRSNHGATNQTKFKVDGDGDVLIPTDTGKLQLGASEDLQIFHDGTHSFINETGSGNLVLRTNPSGTYAALVLQAGQENSIICNKLGSTELYHITGVGSSSKKFETTSTGGHFTGKFTFNDGSSNQIAFGDSEDLKIYHNGTNSFIQDTGTGGIAVLTNDFAVNNAADTEQMIRAIENSSVQLFFDGGLRAFTHNNGWRVNGDCFPNGDGNSAMRLGQPNERWHTVFAITGSINTSDEREKTNINATSLGLDFINKLKPVTYNWKDESRSKKLHYGLVVQDIIKVLEEENIELNDFGAINDEGKFYGLNYSEFISPLIKAVQELSAEVAALKAN